MAVQLIFLLNMYRPPTEADEMVLCTLRVDSNGVLSIKPDFNKGRQPYKVGGGLNASGRGRLCRPLISKINFFI